MKKVLFFLFLLDSIYSFGQPRCSGDACGSISVTNSSASGIPIFIFKNNNKRKVRLFIRTFFFGGGCTDPAIYDLAFGESHSIDGALCDPYTANFIEPPPPPPKQAPVVIINRKKSNAIKHCFYR